MICAVCVLIVMGLLFIKSKDDYNIETATNYEQLAVFVDFPDGVQSINIWKEESDGVYYFFLPSGSENYKITFGNLDKQSTLRLGNHVFDSQESIAEDIEYQQKYEMEFLMDGQSLGTGQVVFVKSANLPSLFVETASGTMDNIHADKEVKEEATITMLNENGTREYGSDIEYIKARGNSTFYNYEKKAYQIKLLKENSLLGMPKAEKWILLANAIDSTLLKNELIFRFAENYSTVPGIQGEYVDLYLNGDYVGNYYLCEKVEVGKNRLNITDLEEETEKVNFEKDYENASPYISEDGNIRATAGLNNPVDITGGYLVEHIMVSEYEECSNAFRTNSGNCYEIVSPEIATVEQAEYICGLFNEMETAMQQEDGIHPQTGKHFSEYIDVDSWTSKYLIEETFHDPDSGYISMYFYKDSDNVNSHIFSGPMWDYDRAFGSYGAGIFSLDDPRQIGEFGIYVQDMMKHEEVREAVYEKFRQDMIPYVRYLMSAEVYHLSESIKASAEMNKIRWPEVYGYYSDIGASQDYLIEFLEEKTNYLQECWLEGEEYCQVVFLDYYGNEYLKYSVKRGECLDIVPTISTYVGIFDGWYTVDDGIPYDARRPVLQDVTYESRWIDLNIILENGLDISDVPMANADPEIFRELADLLEQRQSEATTGANLAQEGEE